VREAFVREFRNPGSRASIAPRSDAPRLSPDRARQVASGTRAITPHIEPASIAISFGWNFVGFGKKHGFMLVEILLVSHGDNKNGTIGAPPWLMKSERPAVNRKVSASPRPLRYLIERHVDSIGLSAQNPARSTNISTARILGLNHRLFET
jgi:hypothetical protein